MTTALSTQPAFRRKSLHEELTDAIREQIVNGDLAAGIRVPEKDLCTFYGVSRTPLREALKVLATEGLLSLEPNRGAWVSRITTEDLDEVFPVMGALEALSGELACKHITDDEIGRIRVLHRQMVKHYEKRELAKYFEVNQRIHEAILEAARNETLAIQYRSLAARVRRARYVANMTQDRWAQATDEHEQIMECLETRDGERLSVVLKMHLEHKLETVRQWLIDNQSPSDA
ncbi:transcriptional regulator, GntR family [Citreicella sp. SE45]|uniref:Transcriptional regulator, GntR family n=1 Tax=Salipiger thiooxidans TaxID=282683 RepID=A0A1G7J1A5_9RHOB|nr:MULTISPECIES: GntR family transcriptional regulator [Salipiger]EEX12577.1 transcriptional regulator, GntR family [Citreicella sp. SE45]NIY94933.1 GntR family transcriptional regulator [Salipiger sp. HF18]NVK62189.1 GntR family transcriptional regulator [Paracoccaceae bacterium]SDF18665.1 transcriptional regulator, GntR family [Salipiger thiooxidans]